MMIDLEYSYLITKFNIVAYFVCLIFLIRPPNVSYSLSIICVFSIIHLFTGQYVKEYFGFSEFYLAAALEPLALILTCVITHLFLKVLHTKVSFYIYILYLLMSVSYLIIHRVRVVIYDSDEPIMWFITSHSILINSIYFVVFCLFIYGSKVKWKLLFGYLYLWFLRSYLSCLKAIKTRRK